jgi:hypothetical protein
VTPRPAQFDQAGTVQALQSLQGLLEREYALLQSQDAQALHAVSRDKSAQLARLAPLLALLGRPDWRNVLPPAQRDALGELIRDCQRRTQVNDALLGLKSRRTHSALQTRQGNPANYDSLGHCRYRVAGSLYNVA